jgi:CRP-like cAMP-binding protein
VPIPSLVGVPFARRRDFHPGEFLVEAGCATDTVYLVASGQIRSYLLSEDGCETTTGVLGPGQLVGIGGLFGSHCHLVFGQALTPVLTWAMPTVQLYQEVWGNSMLLGLLVGALAQRMALAEGLLRDVLLLPVRDRLGDVQLRLAATLGGTPALSRSQLAGLVQARPETLTRVIPTSGWATKHTCSTYPARRSFHAGDALRDIDAPPGHVNVVVEGQLQLCLSGADKRQINVSTLDAGDVVGISGLVGLPPSGLGAIALTDGTLRTLDARDFLRQVVAEPGALPRLARQLGRELVELERQLSFAARRTVRQRLLACLCELDQLPGSRPPSHALLARHIGASRETVTRALRVLEQDGIIARDGRRVRVQLRTGFLLAQNAHQEGQHRYRVHKTARNPHDEASQLLIVER